MRIILVNILILLSIYTFGQKAPLQSQYMFNSIALNPAFTGSENALSIAASYRAQWLSFPGAPQTVFLTAHTPLKKYNSSVGLQFFGDKIGVQHNNGIFGTYSYRLKFKNKSNLLFGVAAGINLYSSYENTLLANDQNDNSINQNVVNFTSPDFSFGMHYHTKKYFISFSIPTFLNYKYQNNTIRVGNDFKSYNFLLGGGYLIKFKKPQYELKPSLLIRYHINNPIQFDLNMMARIHQIFSFGFSYRYLESIIMLIKLDINEQLSFMYSFDITTSGINKATYGSHEISLKYNFLYKRPNVSNPRFLGW